MPQSGVRRRRGWRRSEFVKALGPQDQVKANEEEYRRRKRMLRLCEPPSDGPLEWSGRGGGI